MSTASNRGLESWATYLLKRVPESLKADIAAEAAQFSTSSANVVRSILCDHYGLECEPLSTKGRPPLKVDADTMLMRLQRPLFQAIQADAASRNTTQRDVILDVLRAHFNHNGGP